MRIAELAARHPRIGLDSNLFIYIFEGSALAGVLRPVFQLIEDGAIQAVLASLGLTEVLAGPARARDAAVFEGYAAELHSIPNLRVVPLDVETAIDAGWMRSESMSIGDAVHLATARRAGATAFLTNDGRLRSRPGLEVIRIADLVEA